MWLTRPGLLARSRPGFVRSDDGFGWRGLQILGLGLIICLLLAPGAFAQQVLRLRVQQTATQSLTLIKPTDPLFESTLDSYYPGLSEESGYQTSIRPFLVLVRNDTPRLAMAYAITWTMHYANGIVGSHRAMSLYRQLMDPRAAKFLRPGEIRLVAPMFNVTTRDYEKYDSFAQMYPAGVYPGSQDLTSVDASVDGVVYGDGTFIGADKTRILQRYVMARYGARDEMLAALKLIHSYKVPAFQAVQPLLQTLNQHVQRTHEAHQTTLLAMYVRARGRTAADLERILRNRGFSGLERVLQTRVGRAEGNANSSVFAAEYQDLKDNDPRVFGTVPLDSPKP